MTVAIEQATARRFFRIAIEIAAAMLFMTGGYDMRRQAEALRKRMCHLGILSIDSTGSFIGIKHFSPSARMRTVKEPSIIGRANGLVVYRSCGSMTETLR